MAGSDPATDPLIGQSLSHFRIDAKIGEGGMGVVYRATDERLRRVVALKVLPDTLASDLERRRRFLREARAAAAVSHPNIAAVYDIGEADGHVFIAMELLTGETLRVKMDPGLAHTEALRIAKEIAKGLAQAHESGVVHRDLKPENVIVTRDGGVKILDFGLAKLVDVGPNAEAIAETASLSTMSQTAAGRVMGTPPYMSPEQAEGRAEIDARSDVFSFGTMLYEMLAGMRPFRGDTSFAVLGAVMHKEPEPLEAACPGAPAAVTSVVARCLKKAREERFASGRELSAALEGEASVAIDRPSGKALAAARVSTVSGTGTALGATLPADAAKATSEHRATRDAAGRGGSVARRGGVAAAVVVAAPLSAGAWWLPHRTAATTAPAPSASAPAVAAEGAVSRSSNPEAQRFFDDAMRSYHDNTAPFESLLESAVKADPNFGGAYLRLWSTNSGRETWWQPPSEHAGAYLSRVIALQAELSPRDRELFECLDSPDRATRNARLDAYLARYPADDLAWVARLDGSYETHARALAANPTLVPLMAHEAFRLQEHGDLSGAMTVLTHCLEASSHSDDCQWQRAVVLNLQGDCVPAETAMRRVLEASPGLREAHELLAGILAARGASIDAVREALGKDTVPGSEEREVVDAVIPRLTGDFLEVETVARSALSSVPSTASEYEHWEPARTLAEAYVEAGDVASAGGVAADYLSRRPAWKSPQPLYVGGMVGAAVHGGRMSREEADRSLDEAFRALADAKDNPWDPAAAWASTYAKVAETRTEALAALVKRDALRVGGATAPPGRVLFLAGRGEDARSPLESSIQPCATVLSDTRHWVRTHLYLGELDEQKGDKVAACGHFAKVLERWGHAKPRSVTADEARVHAKGLGCEGSK